MRLGAPVNANKHRSLRQAGLGLAMLVLTVVAGSALPCAAEGLMTVSLDKAKVLKYPANTETIIVGNPIIADVTMLRGSGMLILTGKGFGETNLVFLDRAGTVLSESRLRVEPSAALVTVQRGTERESYACHPRCEPTVALGDSTTFMKDAIAGITSRNGLAAPGGGPAK